MWNNTLQSESRKKSEQNGSVSWPKEKIREAGAKTSFSKQGGDKEKKLAISSQQNEEVY